MKEAKAQSRHRASEKQEQSQFSVNLHTTIRPQGILDNDFQDQHSSHQRRCSPHESELSSTTNSSRLIDRFRPLCGFDFSYRIFFETTRATTKTTSATKSRDLIIYKETMAILEQRKKSNNGGSGSNTANSINSNISSNTSLISDNNGKGGSSASSDHDIIKIRIKPNVQNSRNNYQDVTLSIALSSTVYQLKEKIRSSCYDTNNNSTTSTVNNSNGSSNSNSNDSNGQNGNCNGDINCNNSSAGIAGNMTISRDRYLRLICSGRLLAPDSTVLSEFKCIKDGSVIHAILAAPGVRLVHLYLFIFCLLSSIHL